MNMKNLINNSIKLIVISFLLLSTKIMLGQEKMNVVKSSNNDYYVAAYIWPSCHHDIRFGDMLWPEGIGEWEVIKRGDSRL